MKNKLIIYFRKIWTQKMTWQKCQVVCASIAEHSTARPDTFSPLVIDVTKNQNRNIFGKVGLFIVLMMFSASFALAASSIVVISDNPSETESYNGSNSSAAAPTIIGFSGSHCGPGTINLTAAASAGVVNWYDSAGNWLMTGNNYTTPYLASSTSYYVDATDAGITSSPRTEVKAVVILPATITLGGAGTVCTGSPINLTSIGANLINQYWEGPNGFYSLLANPTIPIATAANAGSYKVTGSALSGINLIANGDFELGNIGFGSNYTYVVPATGALGPEGVYTLVADPHSVHNDFWDCTDHTPSGTLMMVVNGAPLSKNIWTQTVNVVENTDYQFTYWVQSVHPTSPSQSQLYVNGAKLALPYSAVSTRCTWIQFIYNWTSGSGITSAILELRNENTTATGNDFALDDIIFQQACMATGIGTVVINAVPVPGAIDNTQTICRGYTPAMIGSTTAGSGTGAITYEWESKTTGSFIPIPGATSATYSPPALSVTTSFQRRTVATSGGAICHSIYTNPCLITVNGPFVVAGGPDLACQLVSPVAITLTGSSYSGGATKAIWSIVSGGGSLSSTDSTTTPATITYTPVANYSGTDTLRLRTDVVPALGGCDAIAFRTLTFRPTPTASISGTTTVCQNSTVPYITFTNPQAFPVTVTYKINTTLQPTINVGASTTAIIAAPTTTAGTFTYNLVSVIYQTLPACSNTITGTATIIVNPSLPVSLSIVASNNPVCLGATVEFTASPANGGTTPAYQWKVNGLNVGTNITTYSYAPLTGDKITCVLTSNATPCAITNPATSNEVIMIFSAAPTAGTLTPNIPVGTVCAGTNVSAAATAGSNGAGTIIDILEYRYNGGSWLPYTSGASYSTTGYTSIDIRTYRTATGGGCPNSAPVTLSWTINAVPVSGTLTPSTAAGAVCTGTTISATATAGSGGAGTIADMLQYRFDNGSWGTYTSGQFLSTMGHTSVDIQTYRTATGSGCNLSIPAILSRSVVAIPTAPVITMIPISASVASGQMLTVSAVAGTGGIAPVADEYRYSTDNGSSWSSWSSSIPNFAAVAGTNLIESHRKATGASCNLSGSNQVSWFVYAALSASISGGSSPICINTAPGTFTATGGGGTGAYTYLWYKDGAPTIITSKTYAPGNLAATANFYCAISSVGCGTVNTSIQTITVITVTEKTGQSTATQTRCLNVAFDPITFTAAGVGLTYQWYSNVSAVNSGGSSLGSFYGAQSSSYTPQSDASGTLYYYCEVNGTCGNVISLISGKFIVNPILPSSVIITVLPTGAICEGTSVTFTATPVNGGVPTYQWYNGAVLISGETTPIYTSTTLTDSNSITVRMTSNATCATGSPATSNIIAVTVNPLPTPGEIVPD